MKSIINWKKSMPLLSGRARDPFLALQREIDNAINGFCNMFETPSLYSTEIEKLMINPSVDIIEDEKNFKVEVEIPGMGEEDVKVSINDRVLSIKGKKEISKKDEGKNYISREIGYGSYERHIFLPDYIDIDKAKASFKKGMLWITFPKIEGAKKWHREIKVEKIE